MSSSSSSSSSSNQRPPAANYGGNARLILGCRITSNHCIEPGFRLFYFILVSVLCFLSSSICLLGDAASHVAAVAQNSGMNPVQRAVLSVFEQDAASEQGNASNLYCSHSCLLSGTPISEVKNKLPQYNINDIK